MPPPRYPPLPLSACLLPFLLLLTLLLTLPPSAAALRLPRRARVMTANQIVGDYANVPLDAAAAFCPDGVSIAQVEPLQTYNGLLLVIPHSFISLPVADSSATQCVSVPVESNITALSSTVLRRSADLQLDESVDVIGQLVLAQEAFFIGFEVGPRTCGRFVTPPATVSVWLAPDRPVAANIASAAVTFLPSSKYILYYFPEDRACLYQGSAAQVGAPVAVPSPTASTTATATATPIPVPSLSPVPSASPPPLPSAAASLLFQQEATSPAVCFPASARVQTADGRAPRLDALAVGDRVLVGVRRGRRVYSEVFAFTHADPHATHAFVELATRPRNHTLRLTEGHWLLADGAWMPARAVRVGMALQDGWTGEARRVSGVRVVGDSGLYSPQTYHGAVVVDGVVASTYSSVVGKAATAHALLAPVRWAQKFVVRDGVVERARVWLGVGTPRVAQRVA